MDDEAYGRILEIVESYGFYPNCDECWGAQAPCDEHREDFQ